MLVGQRSGAPSSHSPLGSFTDYSEPFVVQLCSLRFCSLL